MTKGIGQDGFRWFLGTVADVHDPLMMGRVRVRILGEHDSNHPVDKLLWSQVLMPVTSASLNGVGETPSLLEGSNVIGFFLDANEKQMTMVMGTFPTIPDMDPNKHSIPYLSRGKQTVEDNIVGPEPTSTFEAQYPYNKAKVTQSGHIFELDDTPEHERIRLYHKSGSYSAYDPDGSITIKTTKDRTDVAQGNYTEYAKGNIVSSSEGRVNLESKNTFGVYSESDININAGGGVTVSNGSLTVSGSLIVGEGATGSFSTPTGERVIVQNGIITGIE